GSSHGNHTSAGDFLRFDWLVLRLDDAQALGDAAAQPPLINLDGNKQEEQARRCESKDRPSPQRLESGQALTIPGWIVRSAPIQQDPVMGEDAPAAVQEKQDVVSGR